MWECRKLNGQTIIPIFYKISPSDVRRMAGDFGEAFNLHEIENVDSSTLKKWREVLRETADLSGYSGNLYEGYEGQLVEEVVLRVARILRDDGLVVTDKLVGIELHVEEMMRKLGVAHGKGRATEVRGEDVRVIGICGVPGVGKTTLAKVVFNKMRDMFDACSFLPGISSKGVQFSRRMLIADLHMEKHVLESSGDRIEEIASLCRNAKVLIVLDDVNEEDQIKALAGELTWFGPKSRIIVTTNKRRVLSAFDVGADDLGTVETHEVEPRSDDHALQLFRNHYFQGDAPEDVSECGSLS
ncbi:hypothetical protein BT93_J1123 [Corymbia citriodora subsp. variegata]|nr:hypothetical protein BT93_J1123 [Corymbia citriodora subsp. variegata]